MDFTSGTVLAYDHGYMKNFSSFLILLSLSACSSAPKPVETPTEAPAWVKNPQGNYPETRFLVAVGEGRSRDAAIEDAKKQLAESFVVRVRSETQSNGSSSMDQNTNGSVSGSASSNTQKNLSLQTDTFLRGAEVKESAQVNTAGGTTNYALVALDRLSARSGLLLEANRIKGRLDNDMDSLESLYTAQKLSDAKTELQNLHQLYGEAAALGMSALIDVNSLESRLSKIENAARNRNAKIIFAVKTLKGADYFERDIQACINDRGGVVYAIDQAPANANKVEISVVERPQQMQIEGWQKIRFDLTAAVVQNDGKMYRIMTTQTETGRTHDAVLEAVSDKLSHDLCENLFSRMSEVRE